MVMAKRLTALALIAAALLWADRTLADALKFGNEGTYPPFSVIDSSGKLTGMEPDLAREMCNRMGAECDIVVMDFKALIPSLLQGKLDGITTQITPLPERKERALFSRIILQNNFRFVVPQDSHYEFTKEGLKGVKIGVQRGGASTKYVTDTFGDVVEPVAYDNPDQIKLDLLAHRIDMTFGAEINWRLELIEKPEGKDWKQDGPSFWLGDPSLPQDERGLSWIVRKDSEALLQRMNAALTAIIDDCTYTRIRAQYIRFPVLPADAKCVKAAG
jgi:arginine/ornithine transport system substrate-binding protein